MSHYISISRINTYAYMHFMGINSVEGRIMKYIYILYAAGEQLKRLEVHIIQSLLR